MARPHGLDDIKAKKIVDAIKRGNSRACAAGLVGVSARTLGNWMRDDAQFLRRVKEADAYAEDMVVDALYRLATDGERPHFEALKFWLKTRRAKTWRELQASPGNDKGSDLTQVEEQKLWEAVQKLRPKETGT